MCLTRFLSVIILPIVMASESATARGSPSGTATTKIVTATSKLDIILLKMDKPLLGHTKRESRESFTRGKTLSKLLSRGGRQPRGECYVLSSIEESLDALFWTRAFVTKRRRRRRRRRAPKVPSLEGKERGFSLSLSRSLFRARARARAREQRVSSSQARARTLRACLSRRVPVARARTRAHA